MTIDLDRLRELAEIPERAAMPRSSQYPSMTAQLLRQKGELEALRRGLREAIAEIELLGGLEQTLFHDWTDDGISEIANGDARDLDIFGFAGCIAERYLKWKKR